MGEVVCNVIMTLPKLVSPQMGYVVTGGDHA
jgi:hypothetical protein